MMIVYAVLGVLVGTVGGAVVGTMLTGLGDGFAGREASFVGFILGIRWGMILGAVAGLAAWWRWRSGAAGRPQGASRQKNPGPGV